jgi:hypothetical protein
MIPIYYNEISYYIGKRIKMILCKNINLTYISVYINLQQNKLKVNINFKIYNNNYKYTKRFNIDQTVHPNNIIDNLVDNIIYDFEIKYNF